jgi:tRNA wybutosine-synthesizing protein 3
MHGGTIRVEADPNIRGSLGMCRDFEQDKRQVLGRLDKSNRGAIDSRIADLCETVNRAVDFYTTSSCAGRVLLVQAPAVRSRDSARWLYVSHELCEPRELLQALHDLGLAAGEPVWLKLEPLILHVACRHLQAAQALLEGCQHNGFKQTSLLSTTGKLVVQITAPEGLACPVHHGGLLMPGDSIVGLAGWANRLLVSNWDRIARLEELFERAFLA